MENATSHCTHAQDIGIASYTELDFAAELDPLSRDVTSATGAWGPSILLSIAARGAAARIPYACQRRSCPAAIWRTSSWRHAQHGRRRRIQGEIVGQPVDLAEHTWFNPSLIGTCATARVSP